MTKTKTPEETLDDLLNTDVPDFIGADADPWSLEAVTSSKHYAAQRTVIYGVPGIGKTSFAATFPKPILLRFEDGAGAIDCPTFPQVIRSMADFRKAYKALCGKHSFQTVILDSLDWLEPLVQEELCRKEGKANIEAFGFGKGYTLLDTDWKKITAALDSLIDKGINVVCICHAAAVMFDPPDSDSYMTYSLKLQKRAAAVWTEWADQILFLNYHKNIVHASDNGKGKAIGDGDRIVYTASRPAYTAKSRWPLPAEIYIGQDVTWTAFHEALAAATDGAYSNTK